MQKMKSRSDLRRRRRASLADSPKTPMNGPDCYLDSSLWVATSTLTIRL